MATITSTLLLEDRMTATMNNIKRSMEATSNQMGHSNDMLSILEKQHSLATKKINLMKNALREERKSQNSSTESILRRKNALIQAQAAGLRAEKALKTQERATNNYKSKIEELNNKLKQLNTTTNNVSKTVANSFNEGSKSVSSFTNKIVNISGMMYIFQNLRSGMRKFVETADDLANINARAGILNESFQTNIDLQKEVYTAAQRSRGSFVNMFQAVAKMGLLAKDAFKDPKEVVAFTELMQKAFRISGAGAVEQSTAIYQLTQAMASGRLQGDEYRTIIENAPMLAKAIADTMGIPLGELKKMSAEGKITSNVIKASLFTAADEINAKFKTFPKTFSDVVVTTKNRMIMEISAITERFNKLVNTREFQRGVEVIVNIISAALRVIAVVAENVVIVMGYVGRFLYNNIAIVIAILSILAIKYAIVGVAAVKAAIKAGIAWAMANPVLFATVAIIVLLIFIFTKLGGTLGDVLGLMFGVAGAIKAVWNNVVVSLLTVFANLYNAVVDTIARLGDIITNGFKNPMGSILSLVHIVINGIIGLVGVAANVMDGLFGTKLSEKLDGFKKGVDEAEAHFQTLFGDYDKTFSTEFNAKHKINMQDILDERESVVDAFNNGQKKGQELGNKVVDGLNKIIKHTEKLPEMEPVPAPDIQKVEVVNAVKFKEEDIKMLYDLATRKYYQQNIAKETPAQGSTVVIENMVINDKMDAVALADEVVSMLIAPVQTSLMGSR